MCLMADRLLFPHALVKYLRAPYAQNGSRLFLETSRGWELIRDPISDVEEKEDRIIDLFFSLQTVNEMKHRGLRQP